MDDFYPEHVATVANSWLEELEARLSVGWLRVEFDDLKRRTRVLGTLVAEYDDELARLESGEEDEFEFEDAPTYRREVETSRREVRSKWWNYERERVFLGLLIEMQAPNREADHLLYVQGSPYGEFIASDYWKVVADYVRLLAFDRCEWCFTAAGPIHVHHDTYAHHGLEHRHLDDLYAVCDECHREVHGLPPADPDRALRIEKVNQMLVGSGHEPIPTRRVRDAEHNRLPFMPGVAEFRGL